LWGRDQVERAQTELPRAILTTEEKALVEEKMTMAVVATSL
jgi:hypothetical protein